MRTLAFLFLLCAGLLMSCTEGPTHTSQTIEGSRTLTTENRSLSKFTSVTMNTVGSVNLTLGSSQKVTVTVNENLVQYIRTTVQGSALMIETEPNHRYSNLQLTVDVTMTSLDKINCNGVGVIKSFGKLTVEFIDLVLTGAGEIDLNLESQLIKTGHTGAGTIILEGKSDRHEIAHSGAGSLRCFKLFTEETKVTHAGAGRIEVRADSLLDVSITGAGSVYYKGHPTIIQSITGTGGLIDAN